MAWKRFSAGRLGAMVAKEFVQMRRDRLTFAMMIGIPLMQLILFGYAINADPKHLPTAVLSADESPFSRSLLASMRNSDYFRIVESLKNEEDAQRALTLGEVQFVVSIPAGFSRELVRGDRPSILVQADATDPATVSNAVSAVRSLVLTSLDRDLSGSLSYLRSGPSPVEFRLHAKYNPEGITQYNIVPGLMGVVLTMTLVVITSLAVTRERERGTMENLLTTPVRPLEVLLGKLIPYILVGYIQMILIIIAARFLFQVPLEGNLILLFLVSLSFIAANLSVGVTFSTVARNQLQAVQMSFFFFLPSILLSGFMFPFRGMPEWAQWIGSALPLTHYLRIVRGILLKGNGIQEIFPHIWPILIFAAAMLALGLKRYRQTLD
jgi:ABC-2 type transport system permease protein